MNIFYIDNNFINQNLILNNQNLNVNIFLNIKDVTNIAELNDLLLKIELDQGDIDLSGSKINWKDDLEINLKDALLNYDKDEIFLTEILRKLN